MMIESLLRAFFSILVSAHTLLYNPHFGELGLAPSVALKDEIILTEKGLGYQSAPSIAASAATVIETHSAEMLYEKQSHTKLFPASTTKIMTALLVIEEMPLDMIASISGNLTQDGSVMGLVRGERIAVRDLLTGLLVQSANDAADELSRLYPGGTSAFVKRMNARAAELNLHDTWYTNPIGYSDPGHVTSVHDLALLAKKAMERREFSSLVVQKERVVRSYDGKLVHRLKTTNELLGTYSGIEGVKTGWTEEAGECFVAQATRKNQTFISVVLKSPDRFGETRRLLDWAFSGFDTRNLPLESL